ncbi:hypothetical protein C900_00522 [Fulvivirga imtechensis AK7]|uniref:Uncharacterized protein n=1 Tax=Fulvivirga imtechensis AK7 TaxID=1237149 RepID=L8JLG1_9BACT|nr:hypothetical protein C900_00522 [Fulvivirga imtechensis AK7]
MFINNILNIMRFTLKDYSILSAIYYIIGHEKQPEYFELLSPQQVCGQKFNF